MKLGVLDIGSNTVHVVRVDARPGGQPVPERSHKIVLRLMRYLEDDAINREGQDALIAAVEECIGVADPDSLDDFFVMATSAIRESANGDEVIARIERKTGLSLDILSGEDEAKLTFLAVRRWFGWSAGHLLLLDIGGGSLEIATGTDEFPSAALSLPLGAGRMSRRFFTDDPPRPSEVKALRRYARETIAPVVDRVKSAGEPDHVVGSSKTIRSLARLAGNVLPGIGDGDRSLLFREQLEDWVPRIARMDAASRHQLPGITEDRTFQIVGGAVVLLEAMRAFDVQVLDVSPWALREGRILTNLDLLVDERGAPRPRL